MQLVRFANEANPKEVLRMLDAGADPNAEVLMTTPLRAAAESDCVRCIDALLAHGADLNKVSYGSTALSWAASRGKIDAIGRLLAAGAPVNGDSQHYAPLRVAADAGREDVVRFLLDHGADADSDRFSALSAAAGFGYERIARTLLDAGADPNLDSVHRAFMEAVKRGNEAVVNLLLDRGIDPDLCVDEDLAVVVAARRGHESIVATLLRHGAKPDGLAGARLLRAAETNDIDMARKALDDGAAIDASEGRGPDNALAIALRTKSFALADFLLERGARIDRKDQNGRTPLMLAAAANQPGLVDRLIARGANINEGARYGTTALTLAAAAGNLDIVRTLISRGASMQIEALNAATAHSQTDVIIFLGGHPRTTRTSPEVLPLRKEADGTIDPLVEAVVHNDVERVRALLPSHRDRINEGGVQTPLIMAIRAENVTIVHDLIAAGADVNAATGAPLLHSPLEYAVFESPATSKFSDESRVAAVLEMLLAAGARIAPEDASRLVRLANTRSAMETLVRHGAPLPDGAGLNELLIHKIEYYGDTGPIAFLIQRGADPNALDGLPLMLAAARGQAEIVKALLANGADAKCGSPLARALGAPVREALLAAGATR